MADLKEILHELKLQRSILQDGGYGRSVRTPWKPTQLLRDSLTCLNFDEVVKKHPCDECLLWDWVPEEHRDQDIPCHFIPLNSGGDSIASLEGEREREKAEKALLEWLDSTISKLEEGLATQQAIGS
jgi:hypothetical protein